MMDGGAYLSFNGKTRTQEKWFGKKIIGKD